MSLIITMGLGQNGTVNVTNVECPVVEIELDDIEVEIELDELEVEIEL